nr:MAG TPA: hypothetical protein [Caudoviricetes sp.]
MSNVRDLIQLMELNRKEIEHLLNLGILKTTEESCQSYHIGKSDYSRHIIQPWNVWLEYGLNPWDADIVKRVLRTKEGEDRKLDYEKIIHICQERIRQLETERADAIEENDEPDYKTVMCPSEADKPELIYNESAKFDGVYRVYGVFQSDGRTYAYLGCRGKMHAYLDLGGSHRWNYFSYDWMPNHSFGLYKQPLNKEDHAVSMELGAYGVSYEKHDYIISFGHLYRYMDATPEGHVYMRFEDDGSFTKGVSRNKIFNEAVQYVKGNNK